MRLSQSIRQRARFRHRDLILIGVLVTLIVVFPLIAYNTTVYSLDQAEERSALANREERGRLEEQRLREINDLLSNPKSGTTPEKIAAVSIGMMAKEVEPILGLPWNLGIEIFPYNHRYNDFDWVSNDIPIKGVGYVQAVFIDRQLVGLGSLDPNDGRLCGGCLEDMLRGERPWLSGLPFHVEGECPECGSSKVVPFGARWSRYNNQKNVCCGVHVPIIADH